MRETSVLVVNDDPNDRERIGGWLEEAGFDVLACPGPRSPDYVCLGGRDKPCPLAEEAGVVVLDMHLATDEAMIGTPGWDLLLYYLARGIKVVALSGIEDPVRPRPDDGVAVLQRPATRDALIEAVRAVTRSSVRSSRGA